MSKKNRHRPSVGGEQNVVTTEPTPQHPVETSQEKTMEASQEPTQPEAAEQTQAPQGPTAKEMAAAEEANQVRRIRLAQQAAEPAPEPPPRVMDVAPKGYDALHEAFRQHNEKNKPKEYIPPPRTPRQMSALQEELEAGRRAQQRAQEQLAASRPAPAEPAKEGFTTPVYRPGDVVPDPIINKAGGSAVGGTRQYGPDAP